MKLAACALIGLAFLTPPSGRPPVGPLERYDPRIYDIRYEVTLSTDKFHEPKIQPGDPDRGIQPRLRQRPPFDLADAVIMMPLIYQGTYSRMDQDSLAGQLWLQHRQDPTLNERSRIEEGLPFHTHLAVIPIEKFFGRNLRWSIGFRVRVFSSRINDEAAERIAWPREWPEEVQDGLKPQTFIESDHEIFKQTVERVSEGRLRLVPPYLAAKDLVRYCVNELQVYGDGLDRGEFGVLRGLEMSGALTAAQSGRGTAHDLVCVCVAILRAANIPARPVIGIYEDDEDRDVLVSWAEFYLPDAGWIPFDPDEMRGKAIQSRSVHEPWPEFGTMKRLNRRIPLAYHFIPPVTAESPLRPAVWGWDPRPSGPPYVEQRINISIVSRGHLQPPQPRQ
jgi:hypothetical protein